MQTSNTLKMDGIAPINAFTTTYEKQTVEIFESKKQKTKPTRMPSNLERAFSGRRARSVLIDLNAGISATPSVSSNVPSTLTTTIRKSSQFQPLVK